MPIFESDRALLDRFRRGDREALTAVYLRYVDEVATLARRVVAVRFEEELSQDDAATRLGCSRRRVRTLEQRVQDGLRKWLKHRGLLD